jgi:hypothetical protein
MTICQVVSIKISKLLPRNINLEILLLAMRMETRIENGPVKSTPRATVALFMFIHLTPICINLTFKEVRLPPNLMSYTFKVFFQV